MTNDIKIDLGKRIRNLLRLLASSSSSESAFGRIGKRFGGHAACNRFPRSRVFADFCTYSKKTPVQHPAATSRTEVLRGYKRFVEQELHRSYAKRQLTSVTFALRFQILSCAFYELRTLCMSSFCKQMCRSL